MDAVFYTWNAYTLNCAETSPASELAAWFSVPGDMDDFIFFDEPDIHSER